MADPQPDALDRPWRLWASIIVLSALAFSFVFGFLLLPVVQGYSVGIDPFTAICRAIGLSPGSPAVHRAGGQQWRYPPCRGGGVGRGQRQL